MKTLRLSYILTLFLLISSQLFANDLKPDWGKTGHRTIGEIAATCELITKNTIKI